MFVRFIALVILHGININHLLTYIYKSGMWQLLGKLEEPLERPATRNEILYMGMKYDTAVKYDNHHTNTMYIFLT